MQEQTQRLKKDGTPDMRGRCRHGKDIVEVVAGALSHMNDPDGAMEGLPTDSMADVLVSRDMSSLRELSPILSKQLKLGHTVSKQVKHDYGTGISIGGPRKEINSPPPDPAPSIKLLPNLDEVNEANRASKELLATDTFSTFRLVFVGGVAKELTFAKATTVESLQKSIRANTNDGVTRLGSTIIQTENLLFIERVT